MGHLSKIMKKCNNSEVSPQNNSGLFIIVLYILLAIILSSFIYVNWNEKNKSYFKKYVLEETIDYQKFNAFYDKMIGKVSYPYYFHMPLGKPCSFYISEVFSLQMICICSQIPYTCCMT